jgi:hypothetical protein
VSNVVNALAEGNQSQNAMTLLSSYTRQALVGTQSGRLLGRRASDGSCGGPAKDKDAGTQRKGTPPLEDKGDWVLIKKKAGLMVG